MIVSNNDDKGLHCGRHFGFRDKLFMRGHER